MSYNPSFYNNFHKSHHQTFQCMPQFVPPPPPPPAYFIPPLAQDSPQNHDQEFVKTFETKCSLPKKKLHKTEIIASSISKIHEDLQTMVIYLNDIETKHNLLSENIEKFSDEKWNTYIEEIKLKKTILSKMLSQINNPSLDVIRKMVAKRTAKRLRLKRVNLEQKKEKEAKRKEMEERSRKIDENLQKIKDDINKAKQEEETKQQADLVLKEVLRKKQDAKKFIQKLEMLLKLHKARQNTAKGRGESISENEVTAFNSQIEKLKSLWTNKLSSYEKEESELRIKLKEDSQQNVVLPSEVNGVASSLERWKEVMFGGGTPQADFTGDLGRFVAVRSKWDRYISAEGTPLPVGWVPPASR